MMFPHALNDKDGYPTDGFLKKFTTALRCYDNSKLVNHGKITLQIKHYKRQNVIRSLILHCRDTDKEGHHSWTPHKCQTRFD